MGTNLNQKSKFSKCVGDRQQQPKEVKETYYQIKETDSKKSKIKKRNTDIQKNLDKIREPLLEKHEEIQECDTHPTNLKLVNNENTCSGITPRSKFVERVTLWVEIMCYKQEGSRLTLFNINLKLTTAIVEMWQSFLKNVSTFQKQVISLSFS